MAKKIKEDIKPKKAAAEKPVKKTVKKKSPTVRKKKAEDIPDEEPKGIIKKSAAKEGKKTAAADTPSDIRGRKRAGKPSNAERSKQEVRDEKIALLCADWLDDIRKERKNIPIALKIKNLPNYLKLLVRDDEVDDESDVTLLLLADKYLGKQKEFHDAEEQSRRDAQLAIEQNNKKEDDDE